MLALSGDDVVQCFVGRGKETADVAGRLADALLVLHQRDAHVTVAVLAEADARRHRHVGLLDQELREFQAAELAEAFRDRRPGEHARRVGAGIGQPARAKLSTITSRRLR